LNREAFLSLVDKYLAGNASHEEEQWLINYYDSFQQTRTWNEQELGQRALLQEQLRQQIRKAISETPLSKARAFFFRKRLLVAASLLTIIISGILLKSHTGLLYRRPVAMHSVVTRFKERKQVQLEDGTAIWMEPGSRLEYPEQFSKATREVTLRGEAFFEVAKNRERPFIIHTGTLSTRVVGTSFNIKAYTNSSQQVTVVSGIVTVQPENNARHDTSTLRLSPDQQGAWNDQKQRLEKIQLSSARHYAQRRYGRFIYDGESMAAVLDDIQQQFHVQVKYNDAIGRCSFYGDFDVKQNVDSVLYIVAAALNAQLTKNKNSNIYMISGGTCGSSKL
jgi:transmembrane sensor